MTNTANELPLIDIAPLLAEPSDAAARADVAHRIGQACRHIGFFAITGHGVSPALRAATFAAAARFFAQPTADKAPLARGLHGPNRGWVGLGTESLDEKAAPDLKEAFNLMWTDGVQAPPNVWPALPGWRDTVQAYFDAVLAVGRRLHHAFARDLGLDEHFFDDKLSHPMATLRLLHYPTAAEQATRAAQAQPGAGTHTDYGNVTLLATDHVPGLQVQRLDGGWLDVPALPEAFVCNIGDCLMRWSNDVYRSTPHRVLPPREPRQSIAFFLDPNPGALVSALPSCVPPGSAPRHPPVTAAEHLRQRFEATYGPGRA
jgi:isopenicillin N synthase-like dioxygenase